MDNEWSDFTAELVHGPLLAFFHTTVSSTRHVTVFIVKPNRPKFQDRNATFKLNKIRGRPRVDVGSKVQGDIGDDIGAMTGGDVKGDIGGDVGGN